MSKYNTKFEKIQEPKNVKYKYQKAVIQRDIIDLTSLSWKPRQTVAKISKNTYVITRTGEVIEVEDKTGEQIRNRRSLRKIFRELRQLIYTNFQGSENEVFLTLTYAEQTNDPKQIYLDVNKFCKKLKRKYKGSELGYIAIVEPHASGNFHVHFLLQSLDGSTPWNPDADELGRELYQTWGNGYVLAEHLDCDNIGAYFIAYFSNMEITDEQAEEYKDDITERNGKKYIKGARLDFYPDYMQIYRHSRNLRKPEQAENINLSNYEKTWTSTTEMTSSDAKLYITQSQYKEKNK